MKRNMYSFDILKLYKYFTVLISTIMRFENNTRKQRNQR